MHNSSVTHDVRTAEKSVRIADATTKKKEIIICMHYPPFNNLEQLDMNFIATMKKYNVKKCIYGHIHGETFNGVTEGNVQEIDFKLVSSDYLEFRLIKI